MEVIFVLVEPSVAENIGAAARALKTMGFNQIRLVDPVDHLSDPARWMAHGSNDVLENARDYGSFDEAVHGLDFIIGTSAKKRTIKNDYYPVSSIPGIIREKGNTIKNVAVVFGREDSGLRNRELEKCDLISTIPIYASYPSLNLAQAVMIYAYELSELLDRPIISKTNRSMGAFLLLKKKVSHILLDLGFSETSAIYRRILERLMLLEENDIHLLHSICNKFDDLKKNSG